MGNGHAILGFTMHACAWRCFAKKLESFLWSRHLCHCNGLIVLAFSLTEHRVGLVVNWNIVFDSCSIGASCFICGRLEHRV